jgi:hypothetical protein
VNILETLQMVNPSQGNDHPKTASGETAVQGLNVGVFFNNCNYGYPGATRFGFFI